MRSDGDGLITRREHGSIVELQLDRKPVNALSRAACERWTVAVRDAVAAGAEAIVLSGPAGVFSGGADLVELAGADRATFADVCRRLGALAAEVARCPVPVAAALTGHCLGAGSVVAVHCDARFMAAGHYRFRTNYVAMGLVPPPYVCLALRRLVGPAQAARLLVGAVALSPEEARALGIVERVLEVGEVVGAAVDWCRQLLSLPRSAMLETRRRQREDLVATLAAPENLAIEDLTERWFGAEVQARLAKLVTAQGQPVIARPS
jgi:enoyl-CoA hydratase/carnithine racemase